MTTNVNNTEATSTVNSDGLITLSVNGQELTLQADQVTAVTDALLGARKEAYGAARTAREAAKAEAKADREKKAAERKAAREAKQAEQLAKLEKKLADLKAAQKKGAAKAA